MQLFKKTFSCLYFSIIIPIAIGIAFSTSACRSHKGITKTAETKNSSAFKSKIIQEKYAQLLNVDENKIDNIKLYSFIDDWYGTPYKYGGNNKNGIDCSDFTSILYNEVYKKTVNGSSASIFNECKTV